MRISDWSSEVCSSDLRPNRLTCSLPITLPCAHDQRGSKRRRASRCGSSEITHSGSIEALVSDHTFSVRSEEHTSELQSLMRISYAVFCLKKKTKNTIHE